MKRTGLSMLMSSQQVMIYFIIPSGVFSVETCFFLSTRIPFDRLYYKLVFLHQESGSCSFWAQQRAGPAQFHACSTFDTYWPSVECELSADMYTSCWWRSARLSCLIRVDIDKLEQNRPNSLSHVATVDEKHWLMSSITRYFHRIDANSYTIWSCFWLM